MSGELREKYKKIKAYIKKGNIYSARSFEKAHFVFHENKYINGKKAMLFVRKKI